MYVRVFGKNRKNRVLFSCIVYRVQYTDWLTSEWAWVLINLIYGISIVMHGQFVSLPITCKINKAASENMQNLIYFSSAKF